MPDTFQKQFFCHHVIVLPKSHPRQTNWVRTVDFHRDLASGPSSCSNRLSVLCVCQLFRPAPAFTRVLQAGLNHLPGSAMLLLLQNSSASVDVQFWPQSFSRHRSIRTSWHSVCRPLSAAHPSPSTLSHRGLKTFCPCVRTADFDTARVFQLLMFPLLAVFHHHLLGLLLCPGGVSPLAAKK